MPSATKFKEAGFLPANPNNSAIEYGEIFIRMPFDS